MSRLLALDSGLTVTKAVIFDTEGREIAVARRKVKQIMPGPYRVERDMRDLWQQTASAIRDVLHDSQTAPSEICAVAATAHGDGLYLLDHTMAPLGNGILSLDSRAENTAQQWQSDGTAERCLTLTGQMPHASAPSSILAWIQHNEADRYQRIAHIISCKDWLRYCLTGVLGTDRTEASTSFTNVQTQSYDPAILDLFGLSDLSNALPEVSHSAAIVGTVTEAASADTGLAVGTPVAAGLHDVTASVLGIGAHCEGVAGIVAGTYSINEAVSAQPETDARWFCRNAIAPGVWNNMSISPASTTNYDWFIDTFCASERDQAIAQGSSIHSLLAPEIDAALARASSVIYHPYLFGSPFGAVPSAGFNGLRGWHNRGDVLAALLEGIVFNHRHHVDALSEQFTMTEARLTGGASRNPSVAQLFADVLNLPVVVTDTDEAAAWGAALCAGAAVGVFDTFDADPRDLDVSSVVYQPDADRSAHYEERFGIYRELTELLPKAWPDLNSLEEKNRTSRND